MLAQAKVCTMSFKWPILRNDKPGRILTILDIGSSKVVCFIARLVYCKDATQLYARSHRVEILGYGVQGSKGIDAGSIMNISLVEKAINLAVACAEEMAQIRVESIIVNMSQGTLASNLVDAQIPLSQDAVSKDNLQDVLQKIVYQAYHGKRLAIHTFPISYSLDGHIVDSPLAMIGSSLGVKAHVLTIDSSALHNLEICLSRCMLNIEAVVCAPLASSLSVLLEHEINLGAVCIDLGAGTTSFTVYRNKQLVYAGSIRLGGNHITSDISKGLSISSNEAETLKIRQGLVANSAAGEDLSGIITARVEEILYMVKKQLLCAKHNDIEGKSLVLTGGGAQIAGLANLAQKIFAMKTRLGRPLGISRLPNFAKTPAYAAAVGLLVYPQDVAAKDIYSLQLSQNSQMGNNKFERFEQWGRSFMRMLS